MKEGLVNLPKEIVILRERWRNGKVTCLAKWLLSEIPDSEADKINTSIREILENSESPNDCRFHTTKYNRETGRVTYRVVRSGSHYTRNKS